MAAISTSGDYLRSFAVAISVEIMANKAYELVEHLAISDSKAAPAVSSTSIVPSSRAFVAPVLRFS